MKCNVELNHAWIPVQHHRNAPGREGAECVSKRQTSSPYWTAMHSGFFVCFCKIFVFMVNGLEKSPPYHRLHISATDWDLLCCAREDGVLENRAFSPSSDWGYFSLLLVPAADGHGTMFKVISESWPDLKKKPCKKVIFILLFVLKSDQFPMPAHGEVAQILVSYWKQVIWEQLKSQIFHFLKP